MFANYWLGCERWQQWGRDGFFAEQFPPGREAVPGAKVLELLLVNRLIDPGSEFRLQRQWFDHSARGELLGLDFAVAEKDRLDRCRDPLLPHKRELFLYLRQRWATLFGARFALAGTAPLHPTGAASEAAVAPPEVVVAGATTVPHPVAARRRLPARTAPSVVETYE